MDVIIINNKIYVVLENHDKAVLKFPKCGIETMAYIGKNGLTHEKEEGDWRTPIGEFELGVILGMHLTGTNKNGLNCIKITNDMYWVDDYNSKYYNKLVDVAKVEKDWKSAEHLIDYPIQYEYLVEIKVNPENIPKRGSAIFIHCTNNKSTAGCIAIDRENMKTLIENIDEYTTIKISEC